MTVSATRSLCRRLPSIHINTFKQASASPSSSAAIFVLQSIVTRTHTHHAAVQWTRSAAWTHSRRPPPRRSGACAVMARRKNVVHDDSQRHQPESCALCRRLPWSQQASASAASCTATVVLWSIIVTRHMTQRPQGSQSLLPDQTCARGEQ